jgi:peptidyl-Lys metalloendopeptidase
MLKTSRMLFMLVLVMVFAAFTISVAAKGEAKVTLSVNQTAFAADESVIVEVVISNPSRGAVKLLKWYTPFDDVEESLFKVTRDGMPVQYIGAHYKRPQPEEKDFIILKSGESIRQTVDLADYYDLSASGFYLVSYDVRSLNLYQKGNGMIDRVENLKSAETRLWIEGRAPKRPTDPNPPPGGLNSFSACTTSQQSTILTARTEAANYSSDSLNYLIAGATGPRYTTWFGVYSSSRYNTVKSNFTNIKGAMDSASMTFDCGCKKRYYAYVYANQPYNIYLCSIFWQAPMTGTDSKAGTLVHETSHFTVVAGTEDWAYGQTNAKNLANSDPNKAVDNADNHEYFAENTPFQP